MSPPRCHKTGKRCYPSEKTAKRATKTVGNKIRVYLCPDCHRFHVTSQEYGR